MLDYTFKPLGPWPGKMTLHWERRESVFRNNQGKITPLAATLELLERELRMIDGKNVIIQVALTFRDIRLDGRIRADARRPAHPGVILTFTSRHGDLSYPCDTFLDWESNLRAIALHLEHTRMATIYGVGKHGEGYRGFAALPAPDSSPAAGPESPHYTAARRAAVLLLHILSGAASDGDVQRALANAEFASEMARKALAKAHPDAGGEHKRFIEAQKARETLASYHVGELLTIHQSKGQK